MRMQKLPKSTFLKAFQQLFYFPSVKDGILAHPKTNGKKKKLLKK